MFNLVGSGMNQAVYLGLLNPGDTILAMDLSHGGHLTHGAPVSHMGKLFNFVRYVTDPSDGSFDFDQILKDAKECRPKLVLCGYTSYPRDIDYERFKAIADEVGAISMTDAFALRWVGSWRSLWRIHSIMDLILLQLPLTSHSEVREEE